MLKFSIFCDIFSFLVISPTKELITIFFNNYKFFCTIFLYVPCTAAIARGTVIVTISF